MLQIFCIFLYFITVCIPIIFPNWLLTDVLNQYNGPSYIYYKPHINETRIVKAVTINPFEGRIEGFLQSYKRKSNKMATENQDIELKSESKIVLIEREYWNERKNEIEQQQNLGASRNFIN